MASRLEKRIEEALDNLKKKQKDEGPERTGDERTMLQTRVESRPKGHRPQGPDEGDDASKERRPRRSEPPVSVPHTTSASQFLYGTSIVEAALRASRRKLYRLYIYVGANRKNVIQDRVISKLAHRAGVKIKPIQDESGLRMMDKMSGGRPHNGYILEASPLPQLPLTGLGRVSDAGSNPGYSVHLGHQSQEEAQINGSADFISTPYIGRKPLVLLLDQVLDPGNVGAMLRTASFLGVNAVAITKTNSASLTPVALKAAAGASEGLTLFSVQHAQGFLAESRNAGWRVFAAVPASSRSDNRRQIDMFELERSNPLTKDPCILVVGSEGEGLSKGIRDKSDFEVNIPGHAGLSTTIDSLNVSVAAGLLCSAFLRAPEQAPREKEQEKLFNV